MTADEFDRIWTSLKHLAGIHLNGSGYMVPIRAVVEIIHSNLHPEDKSSYTFDWNTYSIGKKDPK